MSTSKTEQEAVGLEGVMRAVLALLADERESRIATDKDARKTEVLLSEAGFSIGEIATLLGKNYDTVRMTLRRAQENKGKVA
jgi:DNA-directed RNA polymerase specialized sigma24 family protein